MRGAVAILALLALSACGALVPSYREADAPISSIATFDAERYTGLWYEVASYPTFFERGCTDTTAVYELIAPGTISVLNSCARDGGISRISGEARLVGPGRFKLRLDGVPVEADYWVLWVDEGYRTAVVGSPSGGSGFILNREPDIPADRLTAARQVLAFNGYELDDLKMTEQGGR